jgi:iron complex outermembrane receptor protein
MFTIRHHKNALLYGAAIALLSTAAQAQAPVAQQGDTRATSIEEIVVTARKRAESLQDAPIAVSAFSEQGLVARGMTNLADISRATPSLTISTGTIASGNPGATAVFMRGVGQNDFTLFTEPAVGIYVDGVYIARSIGSALDFLDVSSVEILRGPQGTLFGRNTIGGVINLTTKRPSSTFGGDATATTGSFNRIQLQGNLNVPLSDTLRTKLSVFLNKRDGYVDRLTTGTDLGNNNVLAGRFQAEWLPTEKFTALLTVDATHKNEHQTPSTAIALSGTGFAPDGTPLPAGAANPVSVFNRSLGGVCATNPDSSRSCVGAAWVTGNPYTENGSYDDPSKLDVFGAAGVVNYDAGPVQLKSISSFRTLVAHYGRESDHTPLLFGQLHYDDNQKQFSQEFQANGQAFNDRFKWVLGAYAFREKAFEHFVNDNRGQVTSDAQIRLDNTNYALFGEGTYDIAKWLHLTVGGRWTKEEKKFQTDQVIIRSPVPAQVGARLIADNSQKSTDFDKFTPRVILSADVNENLMIYGTYSKGFKSGGFNGRYTGIVPAPSAPIPFAPEYVTLYEAGAKFTGFDHRVRANLAAFHMDYTDIQVSYRPNPTQTLSVVGNAAAAKIDGFELETTIIPMRGLMIEGGLSYLDARYTELGAGVPTGAGGLNLYTPFQNTPEKQASLSASYAFDLSGGSTLTPRLDWSYRSKTSMDTLDSPLIRQKAYSLLNASIAYVPSGADWRVSGGITNLTKERYFTAGLFTGAAGVADVIYGRPREWYLSVKKEF